MDKWLDLNQYVYVQVNPYKRRNQNARSVTLCQQPRVWQSRCNLLSMSRFKSRLCKCVALPQVSDQYLYSLFAPNSTVSDFLEQQFLHAISQVLNSRGYPYVEVDLHGIYEDRTDNGLQ